MSNTITFEDARQEGIILPDHYLEVTAPRSRKVIMTEKETGFEKTQKFTVKSGKKHLWRISEDFKLLGNPTKEGLTLCGHVGFEQGPNTMNRIIRELYDMSNVFEKTKACSLPEKDYFFFHPQSEYETEKKYSHPDDIHMEYWLSSRCVEDSGMHVEFNVFIVYHSMVCCSSLHETSWREDYNTYAIRPEATPTATLLLERDGCDGSKEKPWKCLSK